MAEQSESGPLGWDLDFPDEVYLDLIGFPGFDHLLASGGENQSHAPHNPIFSGMALFPNNNLWMEIQAPMLHDPIFAGMNTTSDSDMWMNNQFLVPNEPLFHGMNISTNIDMAISYNTNHRAESYTNSSSSGQATPPTPPESSISPDRTRPLQFRTKPEKRKMHDYLGEFVGAEPAVTEGRNRRPFSYERRIEVAQTRRAKACVRCKMLKIPCKPGSPCDNCIKLCIKYGADPGLSKRLCARQKLLDVRLKSDLWDRHHDIRWLKRNVTSLYGSKRVIEISFVNLCDLESFMSKSGYAWDGGHDGPWRPVAPLLLLVQDFEPQLGREDKHNLNVTLTGSKETVLTRPSFYAIPMESLPSVDHVSNWALDSTRFERRVIFGDVLQGSFMSLARVYYGCKRVLPLSNLMEQAVKLSCLHGIWCLALPEARRTRDEEYRFASKAVHRQIAVIITREIEDLERKILGQLQTTVFNLKGPGRENRIPIWICLWLLMLTYRRTIFHWSSRRHRNSHLELAQQMYNMLISTYSTIFRSSTPLWMNFLKDDVFEQLGRDVRILERMGTLKTEMAYVRNEGKEFQSSHDTLLRTLVFEHEKKLGQEAQREASRLRYSGNRFTTT